MISGFSFNKRNRGHWDVYGERERLFRIRGGGNESFDEVEVTVVGENSMRGSTPNGWIKFKTITAATAWIADELMYEEKVWPERK